MLVIFDCLSVCFYFGETRIDKVGKQKDTRDDTEQHTNGFHRISMLTICFLVAFQPTIARTCRTSRRSLTTTSTRTTVPRSCRAVPRTCPTRYWFPSHYLLRAGLFFSSSLVLSQTFPLIHLTCCTALLPSILSSKYSQTNKNDAITFFFLN